MFEISELIKIQMLEGHILIVDGAEQILKNCIHVLLRDDIILQGLQILVIFVIKGHYEVSVIILNLT